MPRGYNKKLPGVTAQVFLDDVEYDLTELFDSLKINEADVTGDLFEQPGLYAYWAMLAEEANSVVDNARRRLELMEAILDEEIRTDARNDGEKITEKLIERRMVQTKRYKERHQEHLDAKRDAALFGIGRRSLEQRMSALIAINSMRRAEYASVGREANQ
jgi:hypothetical protein